MFSRKIFGKFIASKKPRNIPGLTGKTERILTKCLDLSSVLLNHIINTVKKQALFVGQICNPMHISVIFKYKFLHKDGIKSMHFFQAKTLQVKMSTKPFIPVNCSSIWNK